MHSNNPGDYEPIFADINDLIDPARLTDDVWGGGDITPRIHHRSHLYQAALYIALAVERYDPVFTHLERDTLSDENKAVFNGFFAAKSVMELAGLETDTLADFNVRSDIARYVPIATLTDSREAEHDGNVRDQIDELGTQVMEAGQQAYRHIFPSLHHLIEENLFRIDPGYPTSNNITLHSYMQTGAGWAIMSLYEQFRQQVINPRASQLEATVLGDTFDMDAALESFDFGSLED